VQQVGEAAPGQSGGRRGRQQVETWLSAALAGQGGGRRNQHLRRATNLAFLCASPCHSCAPPAGKRHGCAMLVVPVSGAPGGPAELHGSTSHHQGPVRMPSVRCTSS
jgi:hypothetical protein